MIDAIWFSLLMMVAVLYGWIEYVVYRDGFQSTGKRLWGAFTWSYHIPVIVLWLMICHMVHHTWAIGIFAMVQDISWYAFNKNDMLDRNDWVAGGMGGYTVFGKFIPWTYHILIAISLGLYYFTR